MSRESSARDLSQSVRRHHAQAFVSHSIAALRPVCLGWHSSAFSYDMFCSCSPTQECVQSEASIACLLSGEADLVERLYSMWRYDPDSFWEPCRSSTFTFSVSIPLSWTRGLIVSDLADEQEVKRTRCAECKRLREGLLECNRTSVASIRSLIGCASLRILCPTSPLPMAMVRHKKPSAYDLQRIGTNGIARGEL